jgi:MFS family permease
MPTSPRAAVRRIALARLISIGGGAAAYTALMFTIYRETGSPLWLSAAALATFGAEALFGPLTGVFGDRFNRKRVMIVSDIAGSACFGAMALTSDPGALVALSLGSAIAETPFISASGAAIPNLVGEDLIAWANSTVGLGRNLGILLGPVLGGLLLTKFGAQTVFAANAASFLVSAALVATVSARFAEPRRTTDGDRGFRAGIRFLMDERVLRTVTLGWSVAVVGFGMGIVADMPMVDTFRAGALGFGAIIACWGGGTALGAILGRRLTAATEVRTVAGGLLITCVTGLAIGITPWFAMFLVLTFLMGIGDSLAEVATRGLQQRRTPDHLRSRVSAASDGMVNAALAISFVLGGFAVSAVGPKAVYAIGGATAGLGTLVLVRVLGIRARGGPIAVETLGAGGGPLVAARTPLASPADPHPPAKD